MTPLDDRGAAEFESVPLTRNEYIQVMVHFYRGEVARSNIWRQRLDQTTNWAVVTVAGMISFSFSNRDATHLLLLLSNFVVLGFLWMEARRFRYFAVYRARVRMLEENFLLPVVTRNLASPKSDWRELVAMDLDVPKYKNTMLEALAVRVRNNYFWLFSAIFGAWVLKVWIHPNPVQTWAEMYAHMGAPPLPGWAALVPALVFFGGVNALMIFAGRVPGLTEEEIHGVESRREHWKA